MEEEKCKQHKKKRPLGRPKGKKRFEVRISVGLSSELAEFLEDLVRQDWAETISQAARKCIALAKTHLPQVNMEIKEKIHK